MRDDELPPAPAGATAGADAAAEAAAQASAVAAADALVQAAAQAAARAAEAKANLDAMEARQRSADAETLVDRGHELCRKARWRDAIEPLKRATELDPQAGMAFYQLGDAYNHIDQLAAALAAFESASRLLPDNWRALQGVGIVLDRMRRPQEATAAYQKARDARRR
jgi:tetratricopeptide (TPR) repeat protein